MNQHTPTRPRGRFRLLALLALLPFALQGAPAPAQAASFAGMLSFGGYHVGAFITADGSRAYCLEPGADAPLSSQLGKSRVSELPAYTIAVDDAWGWKGSVSTSATTETQMRQMNWVLSEHGDTADAAQAAAVQIAIWEIRRESGNAAWIDGKYALFRTHGGGAHIDAGKRLAREAVTAAVGPGHAKPSGELSVTADEATATGTLSYPAGTTELSMTGGVFADGTTAVAVTDGAAGTVEWAALRNEPDWQRETTVRFTGDWSVSERYWPAALILHPATRDTEQRIGAGVGPADGTNTGPFGEAGLGFDSPFTPVITTQVPDPIVVRADGVFRDRVTVAAAPGTEWPVRGEQQEPLQLLADGTLFGPFAAPQAEQEAVPEDAPVAGMTELSIDAGPGDYDAQLEVSELASGYYYWVWQVREARQAPDVGASGFFEPDAVFSDRFGVLAERQFVATELRWQTRLDTHVLTVADRVVTDDIRASLEHGEWVRDDAGDRIPATIRLTLYRVAEQPVVASEAPADAAVLDTTTVVLTEPDTWVSAPPMHVPDDATGWVSVQACLVAEDQPPEHAGMIAEWCDDFGVPAETAEIAVPVVDLAETGAEAETRGTALPVVLGAAATGIGALLLGIAGLRRGRAA